MICKHCNYEWNYGGELGNATCPSCLKKTKVEVLNENKQDL